MNDSFVLLAEKEAMWAEMLSQVLRDNGVACVAVPVFGAGLTLKSGMQERLRIYVPDDSLTRARELMEELFPEG